MLAWSTVQIEMSGYLCVDQEIIINLSTKEELNKEERIKVVLPCIFGLRKRKEILTQGIKFTNIFLKTSSL